MDAEKVIETLVAAANVIGDNEISDDLQDIVTYLEHGNDIKGIFKN